MKLNIAYPAAGSQNCIEIDDEKKLRVFYDKRMAQEVVGDEVGDEFKGYVFRISGGNDKQGFPMKQGVLCASRVRLLLRKGLSCYRPRRRGERKRKSVRGCIVGSDIATLNLVVVKKGEAELPGLTDVEVDRMRGPKRASKIRKMFELSKDDDVRKYVTTFSRTLTDKKTGKLRTKRPKIQRLVTPLTLQRKRARSAVKRVARDKSKAEAAAYKKLAAQRAAEEKQRRSIESAKRRSSRKSSQNKDE